MEILGLRFCARSGPSQLNVVLVVFLLVYFSCFGGDVLTESVGG